MRIKLHHVNLCSTNVPAMDAFYRTVLGLEREPGLNAVRVTATASTTLAGSALRLR
jgi:catechol 2,3-dioxygenase-like lactoylglutathione lyase family enzyme